MDKHDMKEIFHMVKENRIKLDACKRHDFSIDLKPERPIGKKYQCSRCGGSVDSIAKYWYEKGLVHAAQTDDKNE